MTGYRVLGPAALALLASLALAACGGSSSAAPGVASIADSTTSTANDAAATPAASQADREAALLKAAQCMRANGVKDFPDPTVDSSGNVRPGGNGQQAFDRNDPNVRKAFQACQKYFAAARPQFTPEQQQQLQDTLLKYAKCMRQNGYDMPDPQFGTGGGGPGGGLFRDINRSDPTFQKANTACQSILAGAFPGGRGGGFGGPPPGAGGTGSGSGSAAPAPSGGQG
jgi:hypothetical protein